MIILNNNDGSDYVPQLDSESTDSNDSESNSLLANSEPNLEGMEEHPEVTKKSRKRKRKQEIWKRNISKSRKLHGKDYVTSKGFTKSKAEMGPSCGNNCSWKCQVSQKQRLKIFNAYYKLGDYTRQRDFIHSNIEKSDTKTKTTAIGASRRKFSSLFYLPVDGKKVKVCKKMFINTLGIKKGVVDIALKKRTETNTSAGDGREKHKKRYFLLT